MAANIFTGATNSNWGTSTNWSLGAVPTASDGNVATFDATSPNCTVNTSNRVCNAIDFTGYTNTITMTLQIAVSGDITLSSGMGISGTGSLVASATSTLTSNGKAWPNTLTFVVARTYTLADNWTATSLSTSSGGTATVNGNTLTINNWVGNNVIGGTTLITFTGTSTWNATGNLNTDITFDASAALTMSSAVKFGTAGKTITFTNGCSVTATGTTVTIAGGTVTVNISNLVLDAVIVTVNTTFNGTSGFTCSSFSCTTAGRTLTFKNGNTYTITTALTLTGTRASNVILVSSTPSSSYNFTLSSGASCYNSFVNATDADSSGGRIIYNRKGTILRTTNWYITNPDFFNLL